MTENEDQSTGYIGATPLLFSVVTMKLSLVYLLYNAFIKQCETNQFSAHHMVVVMDEEECVVV